MNDFLSFNKMITPVVIKFLFWIAMVAVVIAFLMEIGSQPMQAIATLLIGPLVARIYAELLLVIFNINDNLRDIKEQMMSTPTKK